MKQLITSLFLSILILGCSSNNDRKIDSNNPEKEVSVTDSQIDFPLDSLLSFNSEKELRKVFSEVVQETVENPDNTLYYTRLFPSTQNEVSIYWNDDSPNCTGLSYIEIFTKDTEWKTKEGITIGTDIKTLEKLNEKPFKFYGLGWHYPGSVDWQEGNLAQRNIMASLDYPNETIPDELAEIESENQLESSSEIAKKSNMVVRLLRMKK